ncbi:hypothetical protein OG594_02650 [Streptomyces sp. NBC_01214]|uniref:hypothetical protein n=1 Tax=Streptomyces sp. NBC_01214 TaxID=2903777 RepID=UPI00225BDD2E|nr:hypothetical protein [Streptomyces sp. NBC_01214]MCX4800581.1 hypothetical protein [Streptomyces sp. NBC_01214]
MSSLEVDRRRKRQNEAELVHKLKARGHSLAEIARVTGLSRTQISHRLNMARNDLGDFTSQQMRTDVETLLDDVIRQAYDLIEGGDLEAREKAALLKVISDTAMKKSRLLGIEAPSKMVHELERGGWGSDDAH